MPLFQCEFIKKVTVVLEAVDLRDAAQKCAAVKQSNPDTKVLRIVPVEDSPPPQHPQEGVQAA